MTRPLTEDHRLDSDGNPAGGFSTGTGIDIRWQDGPVENGEPNGAQVEDVIQAVIGRLRFLQSAAGGKFKCNENALTITRLQEAIHWQDDRRADREARGVEGSHQP